MADRTWYFALQGQQHGPYPEPQFRQFLATGTVTAETLVWTEGMANWQKAGSIPDLFSGAVGAPAMPRPGVPVTGSSRGGPLSIDLDLWDFTWRSLTVLLGLAFIIPTPWVIVMYCKWIVSCVHVPGRSHLRFTGRPVTLMWYFAALVFIIIVGRVDSRLINAVSGIVQLVLYWLLIRWFVANISSNGQPPGLRFSGSFWGYLGWNLLAFLSLITIIGWAWVYTAQVRWMCRHIEGTRREVVFNATGLEFLWRSVVTFIACAFIIPIPWVMRWFIGWQASQVELVERPADAHA
jgi:hypothetical protein